MKFTPAHAKEIIADLNMNGFFDFVVNSIDKEIPRFVYPERVDAYLALLEFSKLDDGEG